MQVKSDPHLKIIWNASANDSCRILLPVAPPEQISGAPLLFNEDNIAQDHRNRENV